MTVEKIAFCSGYMCLLPASVINKKSTDSVFISTKSWPDDSSLIWEYEYMARDILSSITGVLPLSSMSFTRHSIFSVSCNSENPSSSYYIVNLTCLLFCKTGGDDASIFVLWVVTIDHCIATPSHKNCPWSKVVQFKWVYNSRILSSYPSTRLYQRHPHSYCFQSYYYLYTSISRHSG